MFVKMLPGFLYQYANQTTSSIKLKQLDPVNIFFSYHIHLVNVKCALSYI